MKGTNTISMNKATVMEAVQEYLESKMVKPDFDVTDFQRSSQYGDTYVVTVEEREKTE